jgi:hypothetical protein
VLWWLPRRREGLHASLWQQCWSHSLVLRGFFWPDCGVPPVVGCKTRSLALCCLRCRVNFEPQSVGRRTCKYGTLYLYGRG